MRIEGKYRRGQAQVISGLDQARQHRLMAAVHAVEVADGQRDVTVGNAIGNVRKATKYAHAWGPQKCGRY